MIKNYIKLARPQQYYKNLIVLLAAFFSGNILEFSSFVSATIAFVAFCFISSSNYALNDVIDVKKDILNKEKRKRPIAAGSISKIEGLVFSAFLLTIGLSLSVYSNIFFISLLFFLISTLYSILIKNMVIADILFIGANFVIRALAGAAAVLVDASIWLIIGTFFLAVFLAAGKRKGEITFLGKNAFKHRKSLLLYKKIIDNVVFAGSILILTSYVLYSFLGPYKNMFMTIPFVFYGVMRYVKLMYVDPEKTRDMSKIFLDLKFSLNLAAYVIVAGIIIYVF